MTSLSRFDILEIAGLGLHRCLACESPIEPPTVIDQDVVGGKHFCFNSYMCAWCGWWNIFKFRENPATYEIYWCERMEPETSREGRVRIEDFNYCERHPEVNLLMRFLVANPGLLRKLRWEAFQDLVGEYLRDQGLDVENISRRRGSAGDYLCADMEGKRVIVDAKRWSEPIPTSEVWRLLGVVMGKELDAGLIVTSYRFSRDAIRLIERGLVGEGLTRDAARRVGGMDGEALIRWLRDDEQRQSKQLISTIRTVIANDAMMEM